MTEPYLSLVLPVYNGAPFLRPSLWTATAFASAQSYPCEIIVSDDGSRDGTPGILADFSDRVRVLRSEQNRGKGHAVRRGMLAAAGRFVVFTDADLPYGVEPIPRLLAPLDGAQCDLVVGSRDGPDGTHRSASPLLRRLASRVFAGLVSGMVATGVTDTQCGLKGFSRGIARYLFSRSEVDGFAFDVEILSLAHAKHLRVTRLPLAPVRRRWSSVRLLRETARMSVDIARIRRNHARGRYRLDEQPQ